MRAPLVLLLLLLLQSPVYHHATGSELNVTKDEQNMPSLNMFNVSSTDRLSSGVESEEAEDNVKEVREPQFLVNDAGREKLPIKNPANLGGGKKNPNKPKRKGNEKKTKRKTKTPCEGKYKGFCVHGECRYIEQFLIPVCKCHPDYFGERCVEQFLKTKRTNDETNVLKIEVVVVSIFFAVVSFVIIIIVITEQVRKKCTNYNEIEERRNLKKENRIPSSNV
ncbi:amphiregulin [Notechis scutatus]|uniref:Amphiregulin n=1 Tax=Notechis scutatus TaxID=8663 RepID=A0A6J1V4S1_9SAUR|nr:amphiregulin [Notechis scutatus]